MSWYEIQNLVDFSGAHCPCPRYVIVRYKFDAGVDDTRKEAFRAAAADWRTHTCIAVVEDANAETYRLSRPTMGSGFQHEQISIHKGNTVGQKRRLAG